MTARTLALILLLGVPLLGRAQVTSCPDYNPASTSVPTGTSDATGHLTGDHQFAGAAASSCAYSAPSTTSDKYCAVVAQTTMYVGATDTGTLTTLVGYHVNHSSVFNGSGTSPDGGATSTGQSAVAWEWCLSSSCQFTVTTNPVSFPTGAVFTAGQNGSTNCPAEPNPNYCISCDFGITECGNPPPACPTCIQCPRGVVECSYTGEPGVYRRLSLLILPGTVSI